MLLNEEMDTLPEPPPSFEQVISHKLVECGLTEHGFTVTYERDLRSYEVFIDHAANATPEMFQCISDAAGTQIVTFHDLGLRQEYSSFLVESSRPEMIAMAEADLAQRGLLADFPRRADFATDALFAEALEVHCGLSRGEAIRPFGGILALQFPPNAVRDINAFAEHYSCLLSAIRLVSARDEMDVHFIGNGFVGNEAPASPD